MLVAKNHLWTKDQKEDKEELEEIEECAQSYKVVLDGENRESFERRVKYEKMKLIRSKRLKLRRKESG